MFTAIKTMASAGASPFAAKAMLYVIGALVIASLSAGGYLTYKLYKKQGEVTLLTEQNTQLKSNVLTLKGNIKELDLTIGKQRKELRTKERQFQLLQEEFFLIVTQKDAAEGRSMEFLETIRQLKKEVEGYEKEYLEAAVPDSIGDAINDRMFHVEESTGDR